MVPTEQHMAQRAKVFIARYNPCSVTANCDAGVVEEHPGASHLEQQVTSPCTRVTDTQWTGSFGFESRTATLRFTEATNIQSGAQVPRCYRQRVN